MKPYGLTERLIRAVLLGVALGTVLLVTAEGAFTEFYCTNGGSQLNAGSTSGAATYTSTHGNWVQSTRVFTVTDGTNPSLSVSVGQFASVHLDSATVGVYIGRISNVQNATNGTITIDVSVNAGSAPANSTGGETIVVGGAWKGPQGTDLFPTALGVAALVDTAGDHPRINLKNDQTYSVTSALTFTGVLIYQGYTTNPNDGGKATMTSNLTTASNFGASTSGAAFIDIIFANTGASNANPVFNINNAIFFLRCVFHGGRGSGFQQSAGTAATLIECEAYDNNKSNTASLGGFSSTSTSIGSGTVLINCYSHDNTAGVNAHGFCAGGTGFVLINCIAETNGGSGYLLVGASTIDSAIIVNSDFYNNTGDGIKFGNTGTTTAFAYLANNNLVKNSGKGINNTLVNQTGIIYNNGRGAGTQANGSADVLNGLQNSSTDITYASDVTPWVAPTTGNFSINLAAAQGAGRGHFEENDGTNTGTVGYPDIGAAQAQIGCTFPTPTATATATPTSTATATPTATATATFTPTSTPTATATATPTAPIEASYGFSQ